MTPSRDHTQENFPVASRLIAPALRPKVMGFYRFVRTADDVADDPALGSAEKLARLDGLEAALLDVGASEPAAVGLHASGAGVGEARVMLGAFRQDAVQARYADWDALMAYCAVSAAPVGRFLLRLHGEDAGLYPATDALCAALQVLNHVQDCAGDRAALGRVYLPSPWIGDEAAFFAPEAVALRRPVLDALLDGVEGLLDQAAGFPERLRSRRLAMESRVTIALARRLLAELRAADPVVGRVAPGKVDFARAFLRAPLRGPSDAALVLARVGRAGSSFARGMAALRGERRRALYAVYAFCRAVDDIADAEMPEGEKRLFLSRWRAKLVAPDCALSRELAWARRGYTLPVAECEAMIAGMEADAAPRVRVADQAGLDLYCRQVAGSVGAMAVRIFGAPGAEAFGLALGRTLQLVNILRDVDEDAQRDRVYIPLDLLAAEGVADGPALAMIAQPGFSRACAALAVQAREGFAAAERALAAGDAAPLLPARVMMWGYRRLLDRLLARGFVPPRLRPRLRTAEKLRMALAAARLAPV
ncbi:squalene/phytoene synthase family protein [Plastoroseomonas arctica]|uniref:Squalene/phytoene synthase family protein n=1 Tax=Plastoroseomonas arctica TaxID=1509237 RepID=A0AAF1KIL9_9PROT|nr:squalene/phytoene synthase family protein [Plastoroseomonas arctica]